MTQTGLFVLLASLLLGNVVAQDATKIDDQTIEGKWVAKESSRNGPIKLVKEHSGGRTTVTAFDSANRVLYSKTSEYHTERQGNVKVMVFKNSKFTAGPDAGKTDNRTKSYVYRVDANRFYEVRGIVIGVHEPVGLVVWDRESPPAI